MPHRALGEHRRTEPEAEPDRARREQPVEEHLDLRLQGLEQLLLCHVSAAEEDLAELLPGIVRGDPLEGLAGDRPDGDEDVRRGAARSSEG
jgi:hypothetical protein